MAEYELKQELAELEESLASIEAVLKPAEITLEIDSLETEASDPDLWSDQAEARRFKGNLSQIR